MLFFTKDKTFERCLAMNCLECLEVFLVKRPKAILYCVFVWHSMQWDCLISDLISLAFYQGLKEVILNVLRASGRLLSDAQPALCVLSSDIYRVKCVVNKRQPLWLVMIVSLCLLRGNCSHVRECRWAEKKTSRWVLKLKENSQLGSYFCQSIIFYTAYP